MNKRHLSLQLVSASEGYLSANFEIAMLSRPKGPDSHDCVVVVETHRVSGGTLDELESKMLASSRLILTALSDHDFWIPTNRLPSSWRATPYISAEMALADGYLSKDWIGCVWHSDEYSNMGFYNFMDYIQRVRHYGRTKLRSVQGS